MSVPFAFEVINRTLTGHVGLFTTLAPFRYLLRERACALVLKALNQPQLEWHVGLRVHHLTATLLSHYASSPTETEIMMSTLAKTAAAEGLPIRHRRRVEACRVVAADAALLKGVFESYDQARGGSDVFATFAASICAQLKSPAMGFASHAEYVEGHFLRMHRQAASSASSPSSRQHGFNVILYSEADGGSITNDYTCALAVDTQLRIARAIGVGEPLSPPVDGEIVAAPLSTATVATVREMVGVLAAAARRARC